MWERVLSTRSPELWPPTPRSVDGMADSFESPSWNNAAEPATLRGRTSPRTPSSDKTSADRLRDFRNMRREGNKKSLPGPFRLVLEFAPTSYIQ